MHGGLKGLTREQFLKKYYDPKAKVYITKGKLKYLMPLDKKIRKLVEPMKQPYPKNSEDDWHKIDRSQFKKKSEEHLEKLN